MMGGLKRLGLLLGLTLIFASPVAATLIVAMDMEALVDRSDVIVLAEVVSRESSWDEHGRIVTDVTLRVNEQLRGGVAAGGLLTIRCHGGAIGERGMHVAGEPTFSSRESLVFAYHAASGRLRPTGMSQGVMPIRRDQGSAAIVMPGGAGLELTRPSTGTLEPGRAALTGPAPVEAVLDRVRRLIQASGNR